MKRVTAAIAAADNVTELHIRVTAPVKRPPVKLPQLQGFITPEAAKVNPGRAIAAKQWLRSATGVCYMCPNPLGKHTRRCDDCQARENARWRAKQAAYNGARPRKLKTVKRPPRKSRFRFAVGRWLREKQKEQKSHE